MLRNAFDLLAGGAEQPVVAAGKASKKKSKKKGGGGGAIAEAQGPVIAVQAPVEPAPAPRVQTAKEAGEALEAAVVAAASGELGALALDWAEQVGGGQRRHIPLRPQA